MIYDDAMNEDWGDNAELARIARDACNAMSALISALSTTDPEKYNAQISDADIKVMETGSNTAYYLYHYLKDGKVRSMH